MDRRWPGCVRWELGVSPCQSWGQAGLLPSVMVTASFSLHPSLFWDGWRGTGWVWEGEEANQGKLVLGISAESQCWACLGWNHTALLWGGPGAPHVPPELPLRWMGWLWLSELLKQQPGLRGNTCPPCFRIGRKAGMWSEATGADSAGCDPKGNWSYQPSLEIQVKQGYSQSSFPSRCKGRDLICLSMEKVPSSCCKAGCEWNKKRGLCGGILGRSIPSCQRVPIPVWGRAR